MLNNAKYSLTVLATLMLAACGGSGSSDNGGSSSSNANTNSGTNSTITNASQYKLDVAVQSATNGVLVVDNSSAKTIVCVDEDKDGTCDGDSIKSYTDSKGNASLSWYSTADFSDKDVLAISSDSDVVQKYNLGKLSYTQEGDAVTFHKLYLNPISSAQTVVEAEGNNMKELVGSEATENFAQTDPANDKNYQTLIEIYNNGVYSSTANKAANSQVDQVLLKGLYKAVDKAYAKGYSKSVIVASITSMYDNSAEEAIKTFNAAIESGDKAPVASFDYSTSIDGTVKYTNASVDEDGDQLTYHWYLAYGVLSSKMDVTYKYSSSGLYPVVLTVSDGTL